METRNPTEQERIDFIPIATAKGRVLSAENQFRAILAEKRLECDKKGLPFAFQAALQEWKAYYAAERDRQLRMYNDIKEPIKPWSEELDKYCDLNNFDLLETEEVRDENLSDKYRRPIHLKKTVYQFKGYYYKYTIMEDGKKAIQRIENEEAEDKATKVAKKAK